VKLGIFEKKLGESDKFIGLAYHGKDIVFRFIIEYSRLRDFGPQVINNRSIFI
jgi:hypothetical protein